MSFKYINATLQNNSNEYQFLTCLHLQRLFHF